MVTKVDDSVVTPREELTMVYESRGPVANADGDPGRHSANRVELTLFYALRPAL